MVLKSRTGRDITDQFPEVAGDLQTQLYDELVLDGEIVALGEDGLPDFEVMQRHANPVFRRNLEPLETAPPIIYYAFDLLYLDGMSLLRLPLHERKEALTRALVPGDSLQLTDHVDAQGETLFDAAGRMGLEGVVAKERNSPYEPGARSRHWLKTKHTQSQEFVVGGYTRGMGERASTFGALILGHNTDEGLTYCGAVGSGFRPGDAGSPDRGAAVYRDGRASLLQRRRRRRAVAALGAPGAGRNGEIHPVDGRRQAPRARLRGPKARD